MTATNHAITGALMVVTIRQPALALSAAFLSHFVLDMIPHWDHKFKKHLYTQLSVIIDFALAFSLILFLCIILDISSTLIVAASLLGMLPDAMWATEFWKPKISREIGPTLWSKLCWFFHKIQWSETRQGIFVEIAWFISFAWLIHNLTI